MKIAVITGASSGLGEEFARQIDKKYKGIDEIWLIARRKEKLEELSEVLNTPCKILPYDITTDEWNEKYKQLLQEEKPSICTLINNAGYGKIGEFKKLDLKEQLGMIDLNITALVALTYNSIPYLSKNAKVLITASSAGFLPQPYFNMYAATKAFALSFSRALHHELKNDNITVTAVCPGPVDTEFFDVASDKGAPSMFLKRIIMKKANQVVNKALIDVSKGKEVSVFGGSIKAFRVLTKVIPQSFILKNVRYRG